MDRDRADGFLLSRRQVARRPLAGIAKTHRHERDPFRVIKSFLVDAEPVAQLVAALVVERDAGLVHLASRRLADDQQARVRVRLQYRSAAVRQVRRAYAAGADACHQCAESLLRYACRRSGAFRGFHGRSIHPCSVRPRGSMVTVPHQSVYSKTCTTLLTPATLRATSTTASASWWLTSPIRYTLPCAVLIVTRPGSKPGRLTPSSAGLTRAVSEASSALL